MPKILIVEDEEFLSDMYKIKFMQAGYVTIVARDGQEALDRLHVSADRPKALRPAVIILDLHLPKIDGLEVLRRIRGDERTRLLPVVVLSSSDEENDLAKCYHLGANSYVCKPVDYAAFAAAVKELGLYWLLLNRPCP